jgi:AcrR family transcriptional regulator
MPTDRRVQKTRSALVNALMALMTRHGYRGISVDALLQRAHIARSTFYAHFHGKDDLLRENINRLRSLTSGVDLPPEQHLLRFSRGFYRHVHENRVLYLSLLRDADRGATVFVKIRGLLADIASRDLRAIDTDCCPEIIDHAVQFFVGAQWAVLTWWLEKKPALDIDTVHTRFERLAAPVLASVRNRSAAL